MKITFSCGSYHIFMFFFWLLTQVAHQAPLSMVAFSRVTSGRLHFGTSTFTIIERNIKDIFREYFSSLCFDSGKIFMMIIWIIFSCRPRTTYCIVLFSLDTFTIKCGWKVHCTVKTVVFFLLPAICFELPITRTPELNWVANVKMLVSQNSRFSFRVSKLDSFEARVLLQFCLVTHHSLSLPNLSRKIERPLLAGYKLINNNFFKDRSFQGCLVLEIRHFGYSDQSWREREKDRNRFAKEGPNFGFLGMREKHISCFITSD